MTGKSASPATRANGGRAARSSTTRQQTTEPHQFARARRRSWLFGKRHAAFSFPPLPRR